MRRIALFLPNVEGGGAERNMVSLLHGLAEYAVPVDLVLGEVRGPFLNQIPGDTRIIDLRAPRIRQTVLPLARYLRREKPHALLARMTHVNVAALLARKLSGRQVRCVIVEAIHLSEEIARGAVTRPLQWLVKRLYRSADVIVGPSTGVARDLEQLLGLPTGKVQVIYNPVLQHVATGELQPALDHPWLDDRSVPFFLGVGRFYPEKDYETMIRAFHLVRAQRPARLVILGEGQERRRLEYLIDELGLRSCVSLPGFTTNPYIWMRRAAAYVLSSRCEGLPNALIEALVCGCPVIATDCPSGPSEVLVQGTFGRLIGLGDYRAMADAMLEVLAAPQIDRQRLERRGREFSLDAALPKFLTALDFPPAGHQLRAA
jgi:glycosyltransferase involved in cell wall biosynthesis